MNSLDTRLRETLDKLRAAGTYKHLKHLVGPIGPSAQLEGLGEVMVFCSNDYLGLAAHPAVVEAAVAGLKNYGAGTASVRFICGTMACHRQLEERIASFLGTEAALTYVSCWNANAGVIPTIVEPGDAMLSDELNHASIIDAARLAKNATRLVYAHADLTDLEKKLVEAAAAPVKQVVTDGVFSMEGDVAPLDQLLATCRKHGATLVVDDSHAVGVLGPGGRGTHEHFGLPARGEQGIDILTGTLGKALGGAAGGYVAASKNVIEYLIQRSRPQLFSNALPPAVACSADRAIEILQREPERLARLRANVSRMRTGLRSLGYEVLDSATAIVPIIVGETARAIRLSEQLLRHGVFVIGFGFPVVPEGKARLRVQMSAAHSDAQIDRALEAFAQLRKE
jgi:glycine C-acetyltransferase